MTADVQEYQTVVLAALLHDIGKLTQRGKFLNLDKGQHPKFSADFVRANQQIFAPSTDAALLEEFVSKHHENEHHFPPEMLVQSIGNDHVRTLATLVSKADNLSSSERGEGSEQWQDYKLTPLSSVLERLGQETCKESDELVHGKYHPVPLGDITSLGAIFPDSFDAYYPGELDKLISGPESFLTSLGDVFHSPDSKLDTSDFDSILTHMLNLLYRYCWCIPSNTQERIPDVSLFDHLKTTAAIASCLYLYHKETDTLTETELRHDNSKHFCLVVGDISGIQNYIFDIASVGVGGGVAKRLRARSLYVQLCSEIAAHRLLRSSGLIPCLHTIMNSGGKFYLLLPALSSVKEAVTQMQCFADEWFLNNLNGELSLNLALTEFGDAGFKASRGNGSGFGSILGESSHALDIQKHQRFSQTIISDSAWQESSFVLPLSYDGQAPCRSCHKFPQWEEELCQHCWLDREVGASLPQAEYIAFFDSPRTGHIPILGYSASVTTSPPDIKQGMPYLTLKLNDSNLTTLTDQPAASKYLANFVARPDNCSICEAEKPSIASFECLANRANGKKLIGVLKADVDNLGKTFIFGLKRDIYSMDIISRVSTVSRMFDLFFTGWVEHLAMENKNLYVVYSGGDDLFIIGPWDELLFFAGKLKTEFARFTGNPNITLSAGIIMSKHNYPIAKAARDVGEALEQSKHSKKNESQEKPEKDSITLLGRTLRWSEWETICPIWQGLVKSLGEVSSAFLYHLLALSDILQGSKNGDTLGLRFYPLLAYNVARNLDAKKSPEFYRWTESLLNPRPGDKKQQLILDNLGLVTTLLIYSKGGSS